MNDCIDEESKTVPENISELTKQFKFDYSTQDPIQLGEIQDKVTIFKELINLRFEKAEEMKNGGIMQIKGVNFEFL